MRVDGRARRDAWGACQQQLAARLNGPGFELPGIPTDFPVSIVLEDVPIDSQGRQRCIDAGYVANEEYDRGLFIQLGHAFARRWAEYVGDAGHVDGGRPGYQSAGGVR